MCYNYKKIVKALNSPSSIILKILAPVSKLLSDEFYLNLLFKKRMGYQLDLNNPVTFNEKIQWLKINYRKPEFANMVDKWEVKSIISKKIGSQYITKGYGVWDSFDVINFDVLPNKFVLKTTHSSGGIVKVKNKNSLDKKNARKILNNRLKREQFNVSREYAYKNVKPRILAEEYLNMSDGTDLLDYKFYCFNGEPKIMYVSNAKEGYERIIAYYDMDFNKIDIKRPDMINTEIIITKPVNFNKMIELSSVLSANLPFIRIDFFNVNKELKFSEFTFYPNDGLTPFYPNKWDEIMGSWIDLYS